MAARNASRSKLFFVRGINVLRLSAIGLGPPVKKRVERPLRPGQEVLSRERAIVSGRQYQT